RGDMEWAGRIASALQENRMHLLVQPAKPLRGNLEISEYQEVLLRMSDESGKPVPTDALISAAERYNLMPSKLDRWVVQTACRLVSEGRIAADPRRIVAINLSGSSLSDEAFLRFVHQQITAYRIEPTAMCFEVTETAAIRNLSKAIHFLKSLKSIAAQCKTGLREGHSSKPARPAPCSLRRARHWPRPCSSRPARRGRACGSTSTRRSSTTPTTKGSTRPISRRSPRATPRTAKSRAPG